MRAILLTALATVSALLSGMKAAKGWQRRPKPALTAANRRQTIGPASRELKPRRTISLLRPAALAATPGLSGPLG
jgi:hypothetical protein